MKRRRVALINVALLALLVGAFDLLAYHLIPGYYLHAFPGYRADTKRPFAERFPRDYYVPDSVRGFDIGPNRTSEHRLDELTYPIWSNSLGCFDREHAAGEDYVYFAGDSFTWGFAPFESKFGTLVERWTGTPVFKCGVEHTGQWHQYAKLVDVVARTGSLPRAVFVFHFQNDVANDHAHPHTTVVDGWTVDAVTLTPEDEVVRRSPEELVDLVIAAGNDLRLQQEQEQRERSDSWIRLRKAVKRYSLSANIVASARTLLGTNRRPDGGPSGIYRMSQERDGRYWYRENPFASANREAMLAFRSWTSERGIPLAVIIVPRQGSDEGPEWHAEYHDFLNSSGIRFTNLAEEFDRKRLDRRTLYWPVNHHFNERGNEMVARILVDNYGDILGQVSRTPGG